MMSDWESVAHMLLFGTKLRTDARPKLHHESLYDFLDRVDTPYWESVRMMLNDWFSHLPKSEQPDIRGRFQGKARRQTWAAFWELYLHELFRRIGFTIEHHPMLTNSSAKTDFRLTDAEHDFYVEAVIVTEPEEEERAERLRSAIRDEIDKIPSGDFFVLLDARREGNTHPPFRNLIRDLTDWLKTLDADEVTAAHDDSGGGLASLPHLDWKSGDWELDFTAIPRNPEARLNPRGGTFGGGPVQGRWVDDHLAIKANLRRKTRKYGPLNKPYVIALMSTRITTSTDEFLRGMFGHAYEHPDMMLAGKVPDGWAAEGLWLGHDGPQYREVSAVMAATTLLPWNVPRTEPCIVRNPWATHPLTVPLPFETATVDMKMGRLQWMPAKQHAANIFNLPANWPGGKPFPN